MSVILNEGGVLLNGGSVATSEDCCCGGGDTGACCFNDGSCDIETEADCIDNGGTYQGDDTVCEESDCFNCFGNQFHACAEISVTCTGTGADCPCRFTQTWSDNCCFDPPNHQCGNDDVPVSGSCDCPPLTPESSWSFQAATIVVDGECRVFITMGFFPACLEGLNGCAGHASRDYSYPFTDGGAIISDTINGTNTNCTFTATLTWSA